MNRSQPARESVDAVGDCLQTVSMANVLIRDVPDDVHQALRRRAERAGQSLQQYLQSELARLAERPSMAEVLDRIESRSGGVVGLRQAVQDLDQERP